jgi:hypothetical protein
LVDNGAMQAMEIESKIYQNKDRVRRDNKEEGSLNPVDIYIYIYIYMVHVGFLRLMLPQ